MVSTSFRLARIAGIDVGANWSWLVVVTLIVWSLAGLFPQTNAGQAGGVYLAMAIAATLLLFVSLIAHELGHALQARREGMQLEGITLWVFGGVARFRGMFPSAGAELRIAVAGPVVSLAVGAVLLGLSQALRLPAALDGVVFWLGQVNLTLLAFNLLPALPLDGGRVLRALLWRRSGDFDVATRRAVVVARALGQLLVLGGLLLVFAGAIGGGLWIALIGWFVVLAAEAETQLSQARAELHGLRVRDVMVSDPVTVPAELPLDRFVNDVFVPHRYTAYPVLDAAGRVVGVIPFRRVLADPPASWTKHRVAERMVAADEALVLDADAPLEDAFAELAGSGMGRALVTDDGRGFGLLSITDVVRAIELRRSQRAR